MQNPIIKITKDLYLYLHFMYRQPEICSEPMNIQLLYGIELSSDHLQKQVH
jgi:hypothetical protein